MTTKIFIRAEVKTTTDATFIALGRQGLTPKAPGYEVVTPGSTTLCDTYDIAVNTAQSLKARFYPEATIIVE